MTDNPLPAATIILLHEDENGIQAFMQERHRDSGAFSSMLVFPGGKVDAGDRDPRWSDHCRDGGDGDPEQLAHRVAAIRESFEESGVLLARAEGENTLLDGARVAALANYRAMLQSGTLEFMVFVQQQRLCLACDALSYFAHWITPAFEARRFDTRFFLARVPGSQRQLLGHDGFETVDSTWVAPADALEDARAGRRKLIFPTLRNLERLARYSSVEMAQRDCMTTPVVAIEPVIDKRDDGVYVRIPANAGYPVCEERIPDTVLKSLLGDK
jgi:8-oxo-dGTP pyrophosphatase MutT (NUDIX family)